MEGHVHVSGVVRSKCGDFFLVYMAILGEKWRYGRRGWKLDDHKQAEQFKRNLKGFGMGVPRQRGVEDGGEEEETAGAECNVSVKGSELDASERVEAINEEHAYIEFNDELEYFKIFWCRCEDTERCENIEEINDEGDNAKCTHLDSREVVMVWHF